LIGVRVWGRELVMVSLRIPRRLFGLLATP
jgi:hypothetical protein